MKFWYEIWSNDAIHSDLEVINYSKTYFPKIDRHQSLTFFWNWRWFFDIETLSSQFEHIPLFNTFFIFALFCRVPFARYQLYFRIISATSSIECHQWKALNSAWQPHRPERKNIDFYRWMAFAFNVQIICSPVLIFKAFTCAPGWWKMHIAHM